MLEPGHSPVDDKVWNSMDNAPNGVRIVVLGRDGNEHFYKDGWIESTRATATPSMPVKWRYATADEAWGPLSQSPA